MKTKANWTAVSKKNMRQLAYWTIAWMATLAIASFGPKLIWDNNIGLSILFIVINTLVGVGMILKNRHYINGLDEMQRKISLDAMAIALGVGLVGGLSYSLLDQANVISFRAEISHLVMLIGITYIVGIIVGTSRYK